MVFYLDLILLLNFVIDYFILLATGKYLQLTVKKRRLFVGATIGSLYTLVFFIPNLQFLTLFLSKIALSFIIILVSYGFIHLIKFFQTLATFYFVSFVTGGGVFAIQYLLPIEHDIINGIYVSRSSSPMMMISLIFLGFLGIMFFSNRTVTSIRRTNHTISRIIEVEVVFNGEGFKCMGLVDTGNQLYDPITRKPVMVVEALHLRFIPPIIHKAYQNGQFHLASFEQISNEIEPNLLAKLQIVPFRTIAKGMEFILTLRPDKVVIHSEGENQLVKTKVLVGLDYGQLSVDRTYQAIIHPELLVG